MESSDMRCQGTQWIGMDRGAGARNGLVWIGVPRHTMVWYGSGCRSTQWFGMVRGAEAHNGSVWMVPQHGRYGVTQYKGYCGTGTELNNFIYISY